MIVVCFCGMEFQFQGDRGVCPGCGEMAVFPQLTDRDAWEMEMELRTLLSAPDENRGPTPAGEAPA